MIFYVVSMSGSVMSYGLVGCMCVSCVWVVVMGWLSVVVMSSSVVIVYVVVLNVLVYV